MTIQAQLDRNLFEIAIAQKRMRWDWPCATATARW